MVHTEGGCNAPGLSRKRSRIGIPKVITSQRNNAFRSAEVQLRGGELSKLAGSGGKAGGGLVDKFDESASDARRGQPFDVLLERQRCRRGAVHRNNICGRGRPTLRCLPEFLFSEVIFLRT